jgi:cytoskeletal protein CcmA (bactofilin family)
MFVKSSKEPEQPMSQPQTQQPQAAAPAASATAPQPKRPGLRNGTPSIISADLIVRGALFSAGDVQIDGRVDGDIRAGGLIVGEKAVIVGDVYAEEIVVRGRVEGGISARKVSLSSTCHVEGNILHEALAVEIGAYFEGNCRHSDNPLANAPENVAAIERRPGSTAIPSAPPRPAAAAIPAPAPKPAAAVG